MKDNLNNCPYSSQVKVCCVLCGKTLESIHNDHPADIGCWDAAVVDTIVGGYGSTKFDVSRLICGFCDDCAEKAIADGRLIHYYDLYKGQMIEPKKEES